ncbi:hypothetical protein [Herbidospora mongoliensis]|uniref:hypothetical protein n=1 Tax=Herbidospora mongoliensis TaxID=688067 RepID=UPI000A076EA0|nr:hypothetical protein [Herbidospora mongoliensis]
MYWDPLPEALERIAVDDYMPHLLGGRDHFLGKWEERNRLNVPGPFYGAETDTCLCGPVVAPRHVLCDDEGQEFVYRQPGSADQVQAVLDAAWSDPIAGYARDGDEHWTPESVREWWARRSQVQELAGRLAETYGNSDWDWEREQVPAWRDFAASISGGELEGYLRDYLFWLAERRQPREGEPLPEL